jgi:hypothetical protein
VPGYANLPTPLPKVCEWIFDVRNPAWTGCAGTGDAQVGGTTSLNQTPGWGCESGDAYGSGNKKLAPTGAERDGESERAGETVTKLTFTRTRHQLPRSLSLALCAVPASPPNLGVLVD